MARLPKKDQIRTSLILASFEALMPVAGVVIGKSFGDLLGHFAGYTAAVVIGFAGWLMLKPSDEEKEQQRLKLLSHARGLAIIDLGLSISIDELAIGLSLGLLGVPLIVAVVLLGIQAFVAAQLGLKLGTKVSEEAQAGAEKVAGGFLLLVAAALIVLKISGHQL